MSSRNSRLGPHHPMTTQWSPLHQAILRQEERRRVKRRRKAHGRQPAGAVPGGPSSM